MWQPWKTFLSDHPTKFRQIVGHSPLGRMESSLDGKIYNIDAAGYRLGLTLITPSRKLIFGSDFIPRRAEKR
jgi:hypothetical protein